MLINAAMKPVHKPVHRTFLKPHLLLSDKQLVCDVTVEPGAVVWLNGSQRAPSDESYKLTHGDVLCIGTSHLFTVFHPKDMLPIRWAS